MDGVINAGYQESFAKSLIPDVARRSPVGQLIAKEESETRRQIALKMPRTPGIYCFVDGDQRVIYVGKSKALRNRVLSYFVGTDLDEKARRIARHAKGVIWETISHELLALLREQELITRYRPEFNSIGQPNKRQPAFLKLEAGPAPTILFARRAAVGKHRFFGPVAGTKELQEAVHALNYVFQLRDCPADTPMMFADQLELFPEMHTPLCLRHELNSCSGPCVRGCSSNGYNRQVEKVLSFLDGKDLSILEELQTKMYSAAEKRQYERATILRNQFDRLGWLHRRLDNLRQARKQYHGVYPLPAYDGKVTWLLFQNSLLAEACVTDGSAELEADFNARIKSYASSAGLRIPLTVHEIQMQLIVMSWFRKHKLERQRLLPFEPRGKVSGKATACFQGRRPDKTSAGVRKAPDSPA